MKCSANLSSIQRRLPGKIACSPWQRWIHRCCERSSILHLKPRKSPLRIRRKRSADLTPAEEMPTKTAPSSKPNRPAPTNGILEIPLQLPQDNQNFNVFGGTFLLKTISGDRPNPTQAAASSPPRKWRRTTERAMLRPPV